MRIGAAEARVDFYGVLELSPAASTAEIRRAHRRLARASHPDLVSGRGAPAEEQMKRINIAASILLDPVARARYDLLRGVSTGARAARPGARPGDCPAASARPFVPVSDSAVAPTAAWRAKVRTMRSFWGSRPALGFAVAFGVTFVIAAAAARSDKPIPVASSRYRIPKPPMMTTMWVEDEAPAQP